VVGSRQTASQKLDDVPDTLADLMALRGDSQDRPSQGEVPPPTADAESSARRGGEDCENAPRDEGMAERVEVEEQASEEECDEGMTGHPECTSADGCIGNPTLKLVRHIIDGHRGDVYCALCWDTFIENNPDLVGAPCSPVMEEAVRNLAGAFTFPGQDVRNPIYVSLVGNSGTWDTQGQKEAITLSLDGDTVVLRETSGQTEFRGKEHGGVITGVVVQEGQCGGEFTLRDKATRRSPEQTSRASLQDTSVLELDCAIAGGAGPASSADQPRSSVAVVPAAAAPGLLKRHRHPSSESAAAGESDAALTRKVVSWLLCKVYERHCDDPGGASKRVPALLLKYPGQELEVLAGVLAKYVDKIGSSCTTPVRPHEKVVAYGELVLLLRRRFPISPGGEAGGESSPGAKHSSKAAGAPDVCAKPARLVGRITFGGGAVENIVGAHDRHPEEMADVTTDLSLRALFLRNVVEVIEGLRRQQPEAPESSGAAELSQRRRSGKLARR
jgi:hypothetical protein